MAQEYLPAPSNVRLADLMKEHNISQPKLAKEIGCSKSTINRFISGAKGTLTHEQVLKIARLFNVSTDFLLGETNIPDRKNYDIAELGLSVEAARNLYTGRVNTEVVNLLLENARFAELTYRISQYFDDTFASGKLLSAEEGTDQCQNDCNGDHPAHHGGHRVSHRENEEPSDQECAGHANAARDGAAGADLPCGHADVDQYQRNGGELNEAAHKASSFQAASRSPSKRRAGTASSSSSAAFAAPSSYWHTYSICAGRRWNSLFSKKLLWSAREV